MEARFDGVADQLEQLQKRLAQLRTVPIEKVTREGDLGTANFSKLRPYFEYAKNLVEEIAKLPLASQPQVIIKSIESGIGEFFELFQQAASFSLSPSDRDAEKDPIRRRDSLSNQLKERFNSGCQNLIPVLSYLKSPVDVPAAVLEAQTRAESVLKELRAVSEELNSLRESAKQAAQVAGTASYAGLFKEEASKHRVACRWWIVSTIAFAGAAIWLSTTILSDLRTLDLQASSQQSTVPDWYLTAAKALVVSVLLYAAIWSTKNYSSHRHNEVINRHRHNALLSFEAFAKSTADDITKSTVLLQATRCIFEHQPTGYLTRGGASQAQTVFTDVMERIVPRSSGQRG